MCVTPTPPRTIAVDGITLTLVVERKRVKNVNARLREATLSVSAPPGIPEGELDHIILDLARRLLRRAHAQRVNSEADATVLARRVASRFPAPPDVAEVMYVTTQEARWGSYSPATRTVRLHAALRRMPGWVLEAVVAHELAHVFHPNHSREFWALLRRVCPDADRATAFLEGVSWLAGQWEQLPPVERALLTRGTPREEGTG